MTQRKLGGAEVPQPQHYVLGIPWHLLKGQRTRLLGQRRRAGLKQEGLHTRRGCLVRSILHRGCFAGLSGRRLMGPVSASPGVWRRSSSPRIKYEYYYIIDLYRPLRKWTIPTIDRDTETLTDQIYRYTNNMATRPDMRDVSPTLTAVMTASPKNQESIKITYLLCALWTTNKLLFSQPKCYGLS